MKENELRIGNRVIHNGIEIEINSIGNRYVNLEAGSCADIINLINLEDIQPVPLSEEWLLKSPFEKQEDLISNKNQLPSGGDRGFDGAISYSEKSGLDIFFYKDEYYLIIDVSDDDYGFNYTSKKIKFVHQLQNLYYALREKELIIK